MEILPKNKSDLVELLRSSRIVMLLCATLDHDIAEAFNDPISIEDLAQKTELKADPLGRIMRALSRFGIFVENTPGVFAHNELSLLLRKDTPGTLVPTLHYFCNEKFRSAWWKLGRSLETGKSGFRESLGTDAFSYFAKDDEMGLIFDRAMSSASSSLFEDFAAKIDTTNFKTVMDIGGGLGGLLSALLRRNVELKGTLLELPHVVSRAKNGGFLDDFTARVDFVSQDFFQEALAPHDLITLRWILHDWDDETATKILTRCRQALPSHGRVVVIEIVLSEAMNVSPKDFQKQMSDVQMLVMSEGGRERSRAEFEKLFTASGFAIENIVATASPQSIIIGKPI